MKGAWRGRSANGAVALNNRRRAEAASARSGERLVKKGRHRRFEEARSLKRAVEVTVEPCPECGADPDEEHASWCLYESEELDEVDEVDEVEGGAAGAPPASPEAGRNATNDAT
jgi:hypothetical protein